MQMRNVPNSEKRRARSSAGVIGGYLGFVFGVLCVLSVASELSEPLSTGTAASTVLLMMVIGYAVGWLLQPVISLIFPQP